MSPATDIAMPESTRASASAIRKLVRLDRRRCGAARASAAVRAKVTASPSTGSPRSRCASRQSSHGREVAHHVADAGRAPSAAARRARSRGRRPPRAAGRRRTSPCRPRAATSCDRRADAVVREVGGDGDHRQPEPGGGVLRDVERATAADADHGVVAACRAAPACSSPAASRLPPRTVEDVGVGQRRPDRARRCSRPGRGRPRPRRGRRRRSGGRQQVAEARSTAPARMSTNSGLASIRASSGTRSPVPWRGRRGCRPRPRQRPDRGDPHRCAAGVDQLLVAVLVVEVGVALEGGLQGVGQRIGRTGLDQGRADVLAVRLGGVHQLGDPAHPAGLSRTTFISSSASDFWSSSASRMPAAPSGSRAASRVSSTVDGVHRVAVDEQSALGEVVTREPQRVGVVPLLGLVVVHQGEPDAVPRLEGGLPLLDGLGRGSRRRPRRRASPTAARLRSAMSRIVVSPSTGTSAFGRVSV